MDWLISVQIASMIASNSAGHAAMIASNSARNAAVVKMSMILEYESKNLFLLPVRHHLYNIAGLYCQQKKGMRYCSNNHKQARIIQSESSTLYGIICIQHCRPLLPKKRNAVLQQQPQASKNNTK